MVNIGSPNFSSISIHTFAKIKAANKAYKSSPFVSKSNGPGVNPWIWNPAKIIEVALSPGIPRVKSIINAPPIVALFAVSEAISPSINPVPNFSGVFDLFLQYVYAIKFEAFPPIPGSIPITRPIIEAGIKFFICPKTSLNEIPNPFVGVTIGCSSPLDFTVDSSIIWETANTPINRGIRLNPAARLSIPKVYLVYELKVSIPTKDKEIPNRHEINPFTILLEDNPETVVNAKRITAKYSYGPNFNANPAITGPRNVRIIAPKIPPKKLNKIAIPSAFPPSPRFVIG